MRRLVSLAVIWAAACGLAHGEQKPPKPLVTGLKRPTSVAVGGDGRVYLAVRGAGDGGGAILVHKDGKTVPFASGPHSPHGLVAFQQWLFVADKDRVWRIDLKGKAEVFAGPEAFPKKPTMLFGITVDENGTLYVVNSDGTPPVFTVYRIDIKGKVSVVTGSKQSAKFKDATALLTDSASHLLVLSATGPGQLLRVAVGSGKVEKVAEGFGGGPGLVRDWHGRLYFTGPFTDKVFVIPRPGEKPVVLAEGFENIAGLCPDRAGNRILVVDELKGTLTALPLTIPGWEVDATPLPLETAVAFPDLKWSGWQPEVRGKPNPLRPIVLTHAGDGSNRVFVATQHGVIHVFPNDQKAKQTKVFLDISKKVRYTDNQNEEGFLGLAFHPKYKRNGEFFVFYTDKNAKLENVVCRYRVSKDDPNRADPNSEEELLRIKRPFWNHDGGTIVFGPDGYLYVALGDGGAANDPFDNAQNLKTLLGKVLRIDVDRKEGGKPYAIPKDNPFAGRADARPEIWAYGLRNVWRMAFDRETGKLWAGEVGQNLWEEINILTAGGNYGWNRRESLHPFGARGTGPRKEFIDPLWEYHHNVGKSITGGLVYRGERLKELQGHYLYADYVTAKIWALRYDENKGRVVANRPIRDRGLPILSFGEDEKGDAYLLTFTPTGQGIYRFVPSGGRDGARNRERTPRLRFRASPAAGVSLHRAGPASRYYR